MTKLNLSIDLEEEDLQAFLRKALADAITPKEIIEGFINDLVSGAHSNGSDERELAKEYYDRCGYFYYESQTFAQYLLRTDTIDFVADTLDDIETLEGELEYIKANPEEKPDIYETIEEWQESIEKDIRSSKDDLQREYGYYCNTNTKARPLDEELESVRKCLQYLNTLKEGGTE